MRKPSEKTKRIISIVLSLAVLAILLPMTGVFSKNPPPASTTTGTDAPIAPLQGATIRIGETDFKTGLRFTFAVNRIWYESVAKSAETVIGALIMPTDRLPSGVPLTHAALDAAGIDYIELPTETFGNSSDDHNYIYNASVVHIQEQNRARSFTSVGYVCIDGEYYYSAPSDSCSIIEAARSYVASVKGKDTNEELLARVVDCLYLDSVVCLDSSLSLIEAEGYPSPYAVSYDSGHLVIRIREGAEGSLSNISSIVIGDTVYKTGWTVSGDSLSAPLTVQ